MEVLKFIFSDFWVWLGTAILLSGVINGTIEIIKLIKKK